MRTIVLLSALAMLALPAPVVGVSAAFAGGPANNYGCNKHPGDWFDYKGDHQCHKGPAPSWYLQGGPTSAGPVNTSHVVTKWKTNPVLGDGKYRCREDGTPIPENTPPGTGFGYCHSI